MEPTKALAADQQGFDRDLQELITDILSGSCTESSTEVSPQSPPNDYELPATPLKRTYSTGQTPSTEYSPAPFSAKRIKLEQIEPSLETYSNAHMHPSRVEKLKEQSPGSPEPQSPQSSNQHSPRSSAHFAGSLHRATAANTTPLGNSKGNAKDNATWSTLRNSIHRQWDPRKGDLGYEELLKHRRRENLDSVDRYVPVWSPPSKLPKKAKKQPFPFERLPEKVRDKIFNLLLVSAEPIEIEFNWLRPFVKGHARVPVVMQKLQSDDGTSFLAPVPWNKLLADVQSMKTDMAQFEGALETRGVKTKGRRSPARYLTTALLRVSRNVHKGAARAFYGQNTFHFSYASAAWMQLESFLETIGPQNVKDIKHIRIAAPMFHRGMQDDYVEGAILDLMSPATRMAVIKPAAMDRLLSAIKHSIGKLLAAASLETLALDLEHPMASDLWSGRYVNDKRMISVADAEKHIDRKAQGVALLKQASDMLTAKGDKPILTLYHFSKAGRSDVNQFRGAMAGMNAEATKYGWSVLPRLQDGK